MKKINNPNQSTRPDSKFILVTLVAAFCLLPLLLVSRRVRRILLRQKTYQKSMAMYRSRISGRIKEILLAQRMNVLKESDLLPVEDMLEAFVKATGPIDSYTLTEFWKSESDQLKAVEVKSKTFIIEAMREVKVFWKTAVESEETRVLEIEPRGMNFTLLLRLRGKGTPRLWIRLSGDANALENFVKNYCA